MRYNDARRVVARLTLVRHSIVRHRCSAGSHTCSACTQDRKHSTDRFTKDLNERISTDAGLTKEVLEFRKLYPGTTPGKRRGALEFSCYKEIQGARSSCTDRGIVPYLPQKCVLCFLESLTHSVVVYLVVMCMHVLHMLCVVNVLR